jgi:DNA-binding XRE family transcriptional regulator
MNQRDLRIAIGTNIRLKRHQLGLSLNALAYELGVSYQQIQKYEKGQNAPPCDKLILLATIFHCAVDDLMANDNVPFLAETASHNPWTTQGVATLASHFSRIPQGRLSRNICSLIKLIADTELSK